jgi:hypothetical protein
MSLYYVQKLIYTLNRDEQVRGHFEQDMATVMKEYELSDEEHKALSEPDIGKLYVMGVNGQLLMHFAAFRGYAWPEYIEAMREGLSKYGEVRSGLYAAVEKGGGGAI